MTDKILIDRSVLERIIDNMDVNNIASARAELQRVLDSYSMLVHWKLVPVEPTEAMIYAMSAYDGTQYSDPFDTDDFMADYRAMLAVAPQPSI